MESELRSTLTTIETFSLVNSFLRQVWAWICRCRSYLLSHHSLSCHSWECHSCHWRSQDGELNHVGLSVHVDDEDDEKYVFQLKLNHSKCCWTAGCIVLFCLVRKCVGTWGTTLPWARLKADKSVCWWFIIWSLTQWSCFFIGINTFSRRVCFHIVVAVGRVLPDWCQSWRCSRGTWPTSQSSRAPIEKLDISFCHRSNTESVFAAFQYSSFCIHGFLLIHLPLVLSALSPSWQDYCGLVVLSFQRIKSCSVSVHRTLGWVEARRRMDTCSIPLVRASGRKDTEQSPRFVSVRSTPCCHLTINGATWFFTEDHITVRPIVTNGFCAWSNS